MFNSKMKASKSSYSFYDVSKLSDSKCNYFSQVAERLTSSGIELDRNATAMWSVVEAQKGYC